jgi:hypothetical protein
MSELKRNTDFATGSSAVRITPNATGIDESQPWRTADWQHAAKNCTAVSNAGFDPYNHVGTLAKKTHGA